MGSEDGTAGLERRHLRTRFEEAQLQQAATADILKAINQSGFDLSSVLETVLRHGTQLCRAVRGSLFVLEDGLLKLAAAVGAFPGFEDYLKQNPLRLGPGSIAGQAGQARRTVYVEDILKEPQYAHLELIRRQNFRSALGVPILRSGELLGVIVILKTRVEPFSESQIEALASFSDQAGIAIETVRLFEQVRRRETELKEALELQNATGKILGVISKSINDVQPVFNEIVQSATKIFPDAAVSITLVDGDMVRAAAIAEPDPERERSWVSRFPVPLRPEYIHSASILQRRLIDIPDALEAPPEFATGAANFLASGYRAFTVTPMIQGGEAIGAVSVVRLAPGPLPPKRIAILETFADQAVIAIENCRLLSQLREALQQQTATADVLKVISRSTFDLQSVLDVLVKSAVDLCDAYDAVIFLRDGDLLRNGAHHGPIPVDFPAFRVSPTWVTGRAVIDRKPVQVEDLLQAKDEFPDGQDMARRMGHRTILGMPLLRGEEAIGALVIRRREVRPFTPRQIELVETFADQAVIAIENTRLLEELKKRNRDITDTLEQQTATSEILKVISTSPTDTQPVFDAIAENAARLCQARFCFVFRYDGNLMHFVAHHGIEGEALEIVSKAFPTVPGRSTASARSLISGEVEQVLEVDADAEYGMVDLARVVQFRSVIAVPMKLQGKPIGTIAVVRAEPGAFPVHQVELLQTFAGQAVIAIENVRLFRELQERKTDLEEALSFQQGTADVLEVIGRSASNLQPVLDAIMETAADLCRADMAVARLMRNGKLHFAAASNRNDPKLTAFSKDNPIEPDDRTSIAGRVAVAGTTVHVHDVASDPDYTYLPGVAAAGVRTALGVPMVKDGAVIGVLVLLRAKVEPFTKRQIALVQTFADQAVIALSNVQLFENLETRTVELAASLDNLQLAQDRLIQTEKLASLGQLTAGIAHEIKNPLNFINNFSAVSVDLLDELRQVLRQAGLSGETSLEVEEITGLIKGNLEKVVHHGKRADSIVRNMLLHSREGSGDHRPVEINAVVEESLNLAYHGARAETPGFNITLERELDPEAGEVDLYPQEITRVLLNIISNGFYATNKRRKMQGDGYEPALRAGTRNLGDFVEIVIRDNGTGIPQEVRQQIFNPFFTTKPAGEGTGLGLSLSHDIVVKQHSGTISVETEPGSFTQFRIVLPRNAASRANAEEHK